MNSGKSPLVIGLGGGAILLLIAGSGGSAAIRYILLAVLLGLLLYNWQRILETISNLQRQFLK